MRAPPSQPEPERRRDSRAPEITNAAEGGRKASESRARTADAAAPALIVLPVLVDAPTAAAMVGVSERWWAELVRTGQAPAPVRLGRRALWSRAALEQWASGGCPPRTGGGAHVG